LNVLEAAIACASRSASASSRIICQFCRNGSSCGNSLPGSRNGVVGTLENMYMTTLIGAMKLEWSSSWRDQRARTLPRKWMYSTQDTNSAASTILMIKTLSSSTRRTGKQGDAAAGPASVGNAAGDGDVPGGCGRRCRV